MCAIDPLAVPWSSKKTATDDLKQSPAASPTVLVSGFIQCETADILVGDQNDQSGVIAAGNTAAIENLRLDLWYWRNKTAASNATVRVWGVVREL